MIDLERVIYKEQGKDPMFKTWHASEDHMIIYIHSDGGFVVCAEKTYPIKNGVLCFIGKGKYHYTMPDVPEKYIRSKLFVSSEKFEKLLGLLSDKKRFKELAENSFVYAEVEESERDAVDGIFREMKKSSECYSEMNILSGLIKLLVCLDKYSSESVPSASGIMSVAIEYINRNIHSELDIDKICSVVNISKYYFCRQFKKSVGMTVMEYILKTRLNLAKNMLSEKRLSVTEVSESCGFSSVSYFCRVFKEDTGITPLAYRRDRDIL